ncbi:MAG: hypothetical protein QOE36_3123 [Gaiellaceae bacterium]|jgi:hypothetical protein|nr:hypothetical protein [Gaiellaceae bacterium]
MDLTGYVEALQRDLAAVAALGDDAGARAAEQIARALEPALRLRLLDLLGEVAHELEAQLPSGSVQVRLAGRDVELTYVEDPSSAAVPGPDEPMSARLTLRLPEGLKGNLEAAAAVEGLSANSWLVQTIAKNIDSRRGSRRLKGYGRS